MKYLPFLYIFFLIGCVVPRNEYEKLLSENEELKNDITKLNAELDEANESLSLMIEEYITGTERLAGTKWQQIGGDLLIEFGQTSYVMSSPRGSSPGFYKITSDIVTCKSSSSDPGEIGSLIGDTLTFYYGRFRRIE